MRVRVNSIYTFHANGWDTFDSKHNGYLANGDKVRVINLYGCPKANTMGQCYVCKLSDEKTHFAMVSTGSLSPVPNKARDNRKARHEAMLACGLTRVRVNGKTFYE